MDDESSSSSAAVSSSSDSEEAASPVAKKSGKLKGPGPCCYMPDESGEMVSSPKCGKIAPDNVRIQGGLTHGAWFCTEHKCSGCKRKAQNGKTMCKSCKRGKRPLEDGEEPPAKRARKE